MSGGPGQLILATAAAVVGFMVGGPVGASVGFTLGMTIGGIIWPMDGGTQYGPRLADREVQTSSYGTAIPKVWGSYRLSGNIIWAKEIEERADFKRVGKTLFSKGTKVWSYTYFGHFAVAVCQGPVGAVGRIWADSKLIYDPDSDVAGKYDRYIRVYLGTEDQMPDPDIQADQGIANTPAFRGTCYIVFDGLPLLNFSNRIPTISVEIGAAGKADEWMGADTDNIVSDWSYSPAQPNLVVNGFDKYITVVNTDTLEATQFAPIDYRRVWVDGGNLEGPGAEAPEGWEDPIGFELVSVLGSSYGPGTDSTTYGRPQIDPVSGDVICFLQGATFRSAICRFSISSGSQWLPDGAVSLVYVRAFFTDFAVGDNWVFGNKIYMLDQFESTHYCFDIATGGEDWRAEYRPPLDLSITGRITSATCRISDNSVYFTWSRDPFYGGGALGIARVDLLTGALLGSATDFLTRGTELSALYDTVTNSVIIVHEGGFMRLDPETLAVTETVAAVTPWNTTGNMLNNAGSNNAVSGSIWLSDGAAYDTKFWQVSTATGFTILWTDEIDTSVKDGALFSGPVHLVSSRPKFFSYSSGSQTYKFGNDGGTSTTLGAIIADIAEACEMASSDIDVSALASKVVPGYGVLRESTGRAAIEPLCSAYGVDAPERDGQIVFQWRKTDPDAVVLSDDLGASGDGSEQVRVTENRRQEIELPAGVTVTYAARARDYQTATQSAKRWDDTIEAGDPRSVEFPLVLDDGDAQTLAHRLMFMAWIERTNFTLTLPPRWMVYDPGDVLDLPVNDESVRALVTKLEVGGDGVVRVNAISTDAIAAEPPPQLPVVPIFTPQTLATVQIMTLAVVDGPLLSDDDDLPGLYVGAQGQNEDWLGGAAYASLAGGDYEWAASFTGSTPIGVAGPLASHRSALIDRTNTLRVVLNADVVLSSVTELEMLAGANRLLVGSELLAFATAVQVSPGVYDLSVLLRGMQGTEWASAHASSSRVVVVDDLISVDLMSASIGTATAWKGVSEGEFIDEVTAVAVTPAAVRLKPLSPVHITGERDGSNNLTITWVRRARLAGDWVDLIETPLDEPVESWEVDVIVDGEVARTIAVSAPTAPLSAADQTTDGITPGDPVTVAVYQLSTRVGRGYPGGATI